MALDTKAKRQAVFGVGRPWMRNTFPVSTPTEQWRMDAGNSYGGNALSPPVGGFQVAWAMNSNALYSGGLDV